MWTIDKIKQANREAGNYFFSKDTMTFFASRVMPRTFYHDDKAVFFVTSEKSCFDDPSRVFRVRVFIPDTGTVKSADNELFNSAPKAYKHAQHLALNWKE